MGKILGLDVGIGSLGWAVIDEEQRRIVDLGVRIFESGEEGATKAADRASQIRRGYRSTKRLNKRRKQRKLRIKQFLERENIISIEDINAYYRQNGNNPDVWKIRAEGLDRRLDPIEIAAILINFANYRGYQDFYDDSDEEDAGKLAEAKSRINAIYQERKESYRTIGEMIYKDDSFRDKTTGKLIIRNKAKTIDGKKVTDYKYLIDRKRLKEEVKTILNCQYEYGYEQFTPDTIDECVEIIFHQRDFEDGPGPNKEKSLARREAMMASLKGQQTYSGFDELIGNCPFYPDEKRGYKDSQLYDMYVLINSLSQLRFFDESKKEITCPECIVHECRQQLFERKGILSKKDLEAICKKNKVDIDIPKELAKKKNLLKTPFIQFLSTPEIFPENFVRSFMEESYDDENSLSSKIGYIIAKYATPRRREEELKVILTDDEIALLEYGGDKIKVEKSSGGANVSFKYMKEAILAFFDGLKYSDFQAKFNQEHPEETKRNYLSEAGKLLPISDPDMARNPVVYRTLNETRKIVNAVRSKYSDVDTINIEVAKDIGKSFEQRKETLKFQRDNEEKNEKIRKELMQKLYAECLSVKIADKLIERFTLWKSQKEMCMYSGEKISFAELVSGTKVQVDHIIPQSIVLDETLNNKVLVLTEENQKKKNQLPLQYMDEKQSSEFTNRVNNLFRTENISRIKKEYLLLPFLDDETVSGFVDRNINDTRTISKYISTYLSNAYKGSVKIQVIKGAITSRFRKRWLGTQLKRYDYLPSIYGLEKKTRDLHYYHHAIDAAVVANLTRPYIEIGQDYVKLVSIKKDADYHAKQGNAKTADNLLKDYEEERAKAADKMHKQYGFNREYTLDLLGSGYVPSICEDLREEIEARIPLQIDFDAKGYTEMEKAYYELRQLLNSIRYNFVISEDGESRDVIDPDTLKNINARISVVCPSVVCIKKNGQIVYENKPVSEDVDPEKIKKELDSFTKKLEQRDVKEYISDIRMLSEEEYSERVQTYYDDKTFADSVEIPYVSFKINRKFRGKMTASDNPVSLKDTHLTFKQLEEDILYNLKSPYYVRFNEVNGLTVNYSIYEANKYYCLEIFTDEKEKFQVRGIRYVDIRRDRRSKKLILLKPLPTFCTHYRYLFNNEYIRAFKNGVVRKNGFGAYRSVKTIGRNLCYIRLFSNTAFRESDGIINLAGECAVIEMSILGHIVGERKCGDQSLFITEKDLM